MLAHRLILVLRSVTIFFLGVQKIENFHRISTYFSVAFEIKLVKTVFK